MTATGLHIRKETGNGYQKTGVVKSGAYIIVEEDNGKGASKWGKLKSGAGWIELNRVRRI